MHCLTAVCLFQMKTILTTTIIIIIDSRPTCHFMSVMSSVTIAIDTAPFPR